MKRLMALMCVLLAAGVLTTSCEDSDHDEPPVLEQQASKPDHGSGKKSKKAEAPKEAAGAYMVIDLSGGAEATSYPVDYLSGPPSGGWTDEYKTTKLVLKKIKPGTFKMGSPEGEVGRYSNEDLHSVTLTQSFFIGVFEVTQKQYQLVTGDTPSHYAGDKRPVEMVSYNDIQSAFISKINARTGRAFSLPTEAQWEYACRAGKSSALNSGKNLSDAEQCSEMAEVGRYWYNGGSDGQAHTVVGSYKPNAWGLYDMHGNVWEWCLDGYTHSLGTASVTDPPPASGAGRVVRGGCWLNFADLCRSAYRHDDYPDLSDRGDGLGFRAVCSVGP